MYFQSSLFEHWTMLIVFFFLVLTLSIRLTIKPYNLRKFNSWKSEKHDQITIFTEGVWNNQSCSSVHLSVCLSVCPFVLFCLRVFLIFCMRTKPDFGKRCLYSWVNETNSDHNRNIWHFNESNIILFALSDAQYLALWFCENCISGKNWFSNYRPKYSPPIKLQDF